MILYDVIFRSAEALNTSASLIGSPPEFTVQVKCIWLAEIHDHVEVEIMASKGNMGWLYSQAHIILFKHKEEMYECSLVKLKEFTETKLKEKKFSDEPQIDHLSRSEDGRITTWLGIGDVLEISGVVEWLFKIGYHEE